MKIKNYINCLSLLLCMVWISDLPAQDNWERMANMQEATSWFGSCVDSINEKAYIFGGSGPSETLLLYATTQIFDFKTNTWSLGTDMPNEASAFSAEMVNGKMYIIGEVLRPQTLTTVKEYDPVDDTWIEKGLLPEIFYAQGSCIYDSLIYSFGGRDDDFNLINTVRTYDPYTDTWNELGDMPYYRDNQAVCVYENEIYLFGDNPKLKYTPSSDSWTEINAGLCEIVAYAVPIIDGDTIYLFGGYKSGGGYPNPSNEIWAYIPVQDTIVKLDCEMPFDRFTKGHKYNNYAYLFGGHYNNTLGSVTYEVWRIHLDSICSPNSINEYVFMEDFILHQNYPNPFSGSTVINYELFEPAFISIDIIDVLGKKAAVLINEFQDIGKHEIEWNMNDLSPGIYFMAMSDGKTQQHIIMNFSK